MGHNLESIILDVSPECGVFRPPDSRSEDGLVLALLDLMQFRFQQ
jgi:hypothetical protein